MLLLLARASAPRAHQQLLSSQMLLTFTKSPSVAVRERAVGRIGTLSYLLASFSTLEVRSQAPSSQAVSPSLHSGAACSSGVPARQAGAQVRALSKALPLQQGSWSLLSPRSSLPSPLSARSQLCPQSCAGQHCPRSTAGAQAWQLALRRDAARL